MKQYLKIGSLFLFVALTCIGFKARAQELLSEDFMYKSMIQAPNDLSVGRLQLTPEIYRHLQNNGVQDLRVLNANNQIVPYAIWHPLKELKETLQWQEAQFYPLLGFVKDATTQKITKGVVSQGSDTVYQQKIEEFLKKETQGFLVDVSGFQDAIQALKFSWDPTQENFIHEIQIESSTDLEHWKMLVPHASLAIFLHQSQTLMQDTVHFKPLETKFLRITILDAMKSQELELLFSKIQVQTLSQEWSQTKFSVAQSDNPSRKLENGSTSLVFDLLGKYPLYNLEFVTNQSNYFVQFDLYSSSDNLNWRFQGIQNVYQLANADKVIQSDPIAIRSEDRYWKAVIRQGQLDDANVVLQAKYIPDTLVFLAQGEGPYGVFYGYQNLPSGEFPLELMLKHDAKSIDLISELSLLEEQKLGENPKDWLHPQTQSQTMKKWLVWIVLGLGVVVLAFMSLRLMKQMQNES